MEKFYVCKHCFNVIEKLDDSSVKVICCGEEMNELVANTMDAKVEKHVPSVSLSDNIVKVKVGEEEHPMTQDHYIKFIYVKTKKGSQIKYLNPQEKPEAVFCIIDDEVESVYSYCNLHGLWKKSM